MTAAETDPVAFAAAVLAITCVFGVAYTVAASIINAIAVRLDPGERVGIVDVPCQSCQDGYDGQHRCDIPDHCPCDRADAHQPNNDRTTR